MSSDGTAEEIKPPYAGGPNSERKRKISVSSGPILPCDRTTSGNSELFEVTEMTLSESLLTVNPTSEPSQKKLSSENRVPTIGKVSVTFALDKAEKYSPTSSPEVKFADIYRCPKDSDSFFKVSSRTTVITRKKSTGKLRRRVIDEEGFVRRVACVCVNDSESKVMLITSKKDSTSWLIPGGGLDATELETEAAKREAWEEAGVRGRISRRLGLFESTHPSGLKKHRTTVYVYTITAEEDDFPEAYLGRRRRWFAPSEALKILSHQRPLQSLYLKSLH